MEIKYRKLMQEWEVAMDNPVLDPAFVTKANQFEADLKAGKLTDEQIKAIDNELVEMFNQLEKEELDSPELLKEKRKSRILEAKNKFAEADSQEQISALESEYGDVLSELTAFIDKRKEKVSKAAKESEQKEFIAKAKEAIAGTVYADLAALAVTYKDYPELVELINGRIENEKPAPAEKSLREKIREAKRKQWTYDQLKEIGIKPAGEEMTVEGVKFQRQFLYKIYNIVSIDGEKV